MRTLMRAGLEGASLMRPCTPASDRVKGRDFAAAIEPIRLRSYNGGAAPRPDAPT